MVKQSKRRLRELFQQEVADKTYFNFRFSLDGTLAKLREETELGDLEIYIDEDGQHYTEEETLVFKFDAKTKREMAKTFRRVLKKRKIAALESLTLQHAEVRRAINDYAKNVDLNVQERIRLEIVAKYEPEYEIALWESVLLVMVEKDLFRPSIQKRGGISVEEKIETIVPDDFWSIQSPEPSTEQENEEDLAYDRLKYGNHIEAMSPIIRDKNDALEYMIAVVDTIIMENEELGDAAAELAKVFIANVYVTANREAVIKDGLEPFRERMERLLPDFMDGRNSNVVGTQSHGGIPVVFGKIERQQTPTESSDI